jgi:hypothetical protein
LWWNAFGKTGIGGYIFRHYEEHETMINGLRAFGIKNGTCSSLLIDGGSAFEACADIYNFSIFFAPIILLSMF